MQPSSYTAHHNTTAPTDTPTPHVLCCTLYIILNVGSARCIILCMHGSSDLPIMGTGGAPTFYLPPDPKPPPPHVVIPPAPKKAPPSLPPIPFVTTENQWFLIPASPRGSDPRTWCNYCGLGGCAPSDVGWRLTYWQWFRWWGPPHSELQEWWRYWSFRCRRCDRLHKYRYEPSTWHFDRALQPHWFRIA